MNKKTILIIVSLFVLLSLMAAAALEPKNYGFLKLWVWVSTLMAYGVFIYLFYRFVKWLFKKLYKKKKVKGKKI